MSTVLRAPFVLKSTDLRSLLGITSSTLSELYRKLNVTSASQGKRQGSAKQLHGPEVRRILEMRGFEYPDPAKIIAFMMCKGGVGKTTSAFFVSQRIAAYGGRVLLIDADSQGNLTSAFRLDQYDAEVDEETPILVDVITGDASIEEATIEVTENLHLIPSTPLNANTEGRIRDLYKNPSVPIQRALAPVRHDYDYIIIDCAPALNLTNTAITSAADLVILPVAPDRFSQIGLEQTLKELEQIEADFGTSIDKRIIFTKFDGREFTSLKYLTEIAQRHPDQRFQTAIRTCADVKNVITKHEDLFVLRKSNAREDYNAFALEVMGLSTVFSARRRQEAAA